MNEDKTYECDICGKECSKHSLAYHKWAMHTEEGRLFRSGAKERASTQKGKPAHNKGKKSPKTSETLKKGRASGRIKQPAITDESRKKWSEAAKRRCLGGYNPKGGRGRKGRYKGYWCDSSWELAYVIYNLEHDIPFVRNTEKFSYIFEDKIRWYIPDFIENNEYVEIKGYMTSQVEAKISQFKKPLRVLKKEEMKQYLTYVQSKYGSDYIKLYEGSNN